MHRRYVHDFLQQFFERRIEFVDHLSQERTKQSAARRTTVRQNLIHPLTQET
jgi:hypothetical protein